MGSNGREALGGLLLHRGRVRAGSAGGEGLVVSAVRGLRDSLDGSCLVVSDAHDVMTAQLVEASGFSAVYVGSFGLSASRWGVPDQSPLEDISEVAAQIGAPCTTWGTGTHTAAELDLAGHAMAIYAGQSVLASYRGVRDLLNDLSTTGAALPKDEFMALFGELLSLQGVRRTRRSLLVSRFDRCRTVAAVVA